MSLSPARADGTQCLLLAGSGAWLAQASLFLFGCSVVVAQWRLEPAARRRAPRVFCTDALTLALGSVCAHFLNLLFVVRTAPPGSSSEGGDQCADYVVFYLLDFAVSTPLYFLLFQFLWTVTGRASRCTASSSSRLPLASSDTASATRLASRKSVCWTSAVCLGKAVVFVLFWSLQAETRRLTAAVGTAWEQHRGSELWLSTFGVPVVLNSLQLLATSLFLSQKSQRPGAPAVVNADLQLF